MTATRRWTPAEIARLRSLAHDGATIREAAVELGRSYKGVQNKAQMLGIYLRRERRYETGIGGYTTKLTSTEKRVLCMMACGMSNEEIGERMHYTPWQVRYVVGCIFTKTGCENRTRAALWALRERLLTIDDAWEQGEATP